MIEDLKEFGKTRIDENIWESYYELCMEDSRFSGLTKINILTYAKENNLVGINVLDFNSSGRLDIINSIIIDTNQEEYFVSIYRKDKKTENYYFLEQMNIQKPGFKKTLHSLFYYLIDYDRRP